MDKIKQILFNQVLFMFVDKRLDGNLTGQEPSKGKHLAYLGSSKRSWASMVYQLSLNPYS